MGPVEAPQDELAALLERGRPSVGRPRPRDPRHGRRARPLAPRPRHGRHRLARTRAGASIAAAHAHRPDPRRRHRRARRRGLLLLQDAGADPTRIGGAARSVRPLVGRRSSTTRPTRRSLVLLSRGRSDGRRHGVPGRRCSGRGITPSSTVTRRAGRGDPGRRGASRRPVPTPLEAWRILAGRPRMGADFDDGDSCRPRPGLEGAIDATKGCFLGQESVARVRNLGHPPRVLRHLQGRRRRRRRATPCRPAATEVGHITSAAARLTAARSRSRGSGGTARDAELGRASDAVRLMLATATLD